MTMIRLLSIALMIAVIPAAVFAQDAALIKRGEAVYAAQKCAGCHAIAGKGNARGALDSVGVKLSKDEIHQWIVAAPEMSKKTNSTRKPLMKAYTALPKEDLEALVAYLQTLKKG